MSTIKETFKLHMSKRWPIPTAPAKDDAHLLQDDYLRTALGNSYTEEAVAAHYGQKYDKKYASATRAIDSHLAGIETALPRRCELRDRLARDVSALPAPAGEAAEPHEAMPWPDRAIMVAYVVFFLTVLALSGAVIYANIEKTQPELITNGSWGLYTYFAIPLFFPVVLDVLAASFSSLATRKWFHMIICGVALVGCAIFLVTWSLDSYDLGQPMQKRFAEAFDKAASATGTPPGAVDSMRALVQPYALMIQIVSEGFILSVLWTAIIGTWRKYAPVPMRASESVVELERRLEETTLEVEAMEEHEAELEAVAQDIADRRTDFVAEAVAKFNDALRLIQPNGPDETVLHFRRT